MNKLTDKLRAILPGPDDWHVKTTGGQFLEQLIRDRLDVIDALLAQGKGEYGSSGYIPDDTWEAWLHSRDTLSAILVKAGLSGEGK